MHTPCFMSRQPQHHPPRVIRHLSFVYLALNCDTRRPTAPQLPIPCIPHLTGSRAPDELQMRGTQSHQPHRHRAPPCSCLVRAPCMSNALHAGHKRVGIRLKCTSTLWAFQHAENWSARAVCAVHCSRFGMNGMWLWCCIMSHVSLWCRASCQAYCQSSSQCQLWRIVGGCSDPESSIERTAGHCWRCGS
jgi:hypothetical protein